MTTEVVVLMAHCRELRYCARGIRELFARYGLGYSDFLVNGVSATRLLEATGNDAMAQAAVEVARGRKQ